MLQKHCFAENLQNHAPSQKQITSYKCNYNTWMHCFMLLWHEAVNGAHFCHDPRAENIDNKLQTDMAILDFSKAFDKVAHTRLINKLEFYGIRGEILRWIISFLSNDTQQVVVSADLSTLTIWSWDTRFPYWSHDCLSISRFLTIYQKYYYYYCALNTIQMSRDPHVTWSWVLTVKFLIMKQHVMTNFELKAEWKA